MEKHLIYYPQVATAEHAGMPSLVSREDLREREGLHRDVEHGFQQSGSEGMSNFEHARVFLQQMQDPTFKETTPDFKETAMRAASGLLALAAKDKMAGDKGSGDMTGINNMVADFNKLSSTSGYTMSVDYTGSGGSNPNMHSYEGRVAPVQKKKK